MKKFIALAALASVLSSCGSSDKGELVGVKGRKWHPEKPYGMTLVPGGAFIMGKSDDDLANVQDAPTKTVTVRSFYMDETEITNSEYKQFVNWVKDSTIRMRLAILAEEMGQAKGSGGIGEFAFDDTDPATMSPYDKYMYENYYSLGTDDDQFAGRKLNKKVKLITDPQKYPDEYYVEVMDSMYLPAAESYNGLRTIDVSKLKFRYSEANLNEAVKKKGRKDFYKKTEPIEIYPDTTVWIKDFAYSYNEPMHNDYFWHQAYDDYPVVGVSWKQAKAFCAWRTLYKNAFIKAKKKGRNQINSFRLPTEAEWEYAARGGLESGTFPWGGPYAKNDRGCFLANFKPNRGDYAADGALYTVEAKSYDPNDYNLYNMSGNVAEWTNSSYDASSYEYVSTMNPNVPDAKNERKVTRGGSWKDVAYFLQVSTRDFEYADSARSFIGFRTVQDYMGVQNTGNTPK
ncbi:gliding motility-associated lipoprotein GldK [Flavobacterium gossypii]|jgi:gliding motility-associated lipoprotein GldK|uniref:Gliding motility-associated lipoprotein GldK n=2 Tax=Flavobacterium TaxID=237 RepID=A0A495MIG5_9FLAO|nr:MULTISPECIES: gliding motility lipoprotein GldK [Flavobacterium]MBA9072763.1 gliding motility-associated lipoprotein GldK [Flavobacterium gossypii]RKS25777.1 gliding motility-associated lipoprotein GldK [Flavobacterium endophyticum]WDO13232.1 gliding motility lipoprotein GldK [Flavobacterium sp. WW92]